MSPSRLHPVPPCGEGDDHEWSWLPSDAVGDVRCVHCGVVAHLAVLEPDAAGLPVSLAQPLAEDSWLQDDRYAWFREGYAYAALQTRAIPTLDRVSPEALYFAVWAILHGAGIPDPEADPG